MTVPSIIIEAGRGRHRVVIEVLELANGVLAGELLSGSPRMEGEFFEVRKAGFYACFRLITGNGPGCWPAIQAAKGEWEWGGWRPEETDEQAEGT